MLVFCLYFAVEKNCEGLDHLSELKCLYLHNNRIEDCSGLGSLVSLTTLNLSNNTITNLLSWIR